MDDSRSVHEWEVEHEDGTGETYKTWLCDPCAEEMHSCGMNLKPLGTAQ